MGWFWADTVTPAAPLARSSPITSNPKPPHLDACPIRHKTVEAFTPVVNRDKPLPSSCPVSHDDAKAAASGGCPVSHDQQRQDQPSAGKDTESSSFMSSINPLNYIFKELSQAPAPNQKQALPTSREASTIPKGTGDGTWEYPSPQQMYNALLRKGYTDTDETAVESMVSVHNFLNEGAWGEILDWEKRFSGGLLRGAKICAWGEENAEEVINMYPDPTEIQPRLVRFEGRPKDMTPKAATMQALGRFMPNTFGSEPPFDRHDWYVSRSANGKTEEVRYIIDYYSGPAEHGMPVFYLDVRPAATPRGMLERTFRWGGSMWWRATGGASRHQTSRRCSDEDVD